MHRALAWSGFPENGGRMRRRRHVVALALLLAAMPVRAGVNRWTTQGPYAGNIYALAMDPTAPDTIYAGTFSATAFKTVDGGAHWRPSNNGFTELQGFFSVQALAIDPHAPSTIYAGMVGSGVFKSIDGGASWKLRSDGLVDSFDGIIEGIAIDPSDSSTLYLATLHGVFKSIDAGCTWVKKSVGLPESNGTSYTNGITIDASNPSVLYLGTFANLVYKSVDGAESWTPSGVGIPYASAGGPVVDPANPSHLLVTDGYFITDIGGGHGLVLASDDAGASWHPAGSTLHDTFYSAVVFDPAMPGRVYTTGAQGVFRSDDGGATWTPSSTGLSELPTGPLLVGPGTRLLVGTHSQGVFRSDDEGATWSPESAGIAAAQWASFSVGVSNPNLILAAGSGDVTGIARSTDGGATWAPSGTGLGASGSGVAVIVDPNDASVAYASQWPTIPT